VALINADVDFLLAWAQNGQVPEGLRGSLKQLVERRRKITDLQGQRTVLEGELKAIDQEQSRIRQNMAQLDRNSALYQQYVKKLTDQETRIEQLRKEIARLRSEEKAVNEELRQFVDGIA
jgi:chromosome segregation ATPase